MVWPLSQSCPHPLRSIPAPCANPGCGVLIDPSKESHSLAMFDPNDITKGFLCHYCYYWKITHNDQLPSKEIRDRCFAKKETPKDQCQHCLNNKPNGSYSYHSEEKKVLCAACRKYLKKNSTLPPKQILDKRNSLRSQREQSTTHTKKQCEHCKDSKVNQRFTFLPDADKRLCRNCQNYFQKYKVLPPEDVLEKRFKSRMEKQ